MIEGKWNGGRCLPLCGQNGGVAPPFRKVNPGIVDLTYIHKRELSTLKNTKAPSLRKKLSAKMLGAWGRGHGVNRPSALCSDQPFLRSLLNRFCLGVDFEFPVNILDMGTDGFLVHKQLIGDGGIALAFGQEFEDFRFPGGQG